jgi:predicted SnoaL-like aldol condensation-catalyzing enzyme
MNSSDSRSDPKTIATNFLQQSARGQAKDAFAAFAAPDFRHHNAYFPGDAHSLMTAMDRNAAQHPDKVLEIQRVLHDGDLVAVHSRVRLKPDDRDIALAHIFRFEDGRIAELWDIAQPAPDDSPNEFGLF